MNAEWPRTGMARVLAEEVVEHVERFAADGTSHAIDLRSLPLTPADLDELREILGTGEVKAEIDVAGPTTVYETAVSGVWWVEHRSLTGDTLSETLEITSVPHVVLSPREDAAGAATRLRQKLAALQEAPNVHP